MKERLQVKLFKFSIAFAVISVLLISHLIIHYSRQYYFLINQSLSSKSFASKIITSDYDSSNYQIPEIIHAGKESKFDDKLCTQIIESQSFATEYGKKRVGLKDEDFNMSMDCPSIRSRGLYYDDPLTKEEAEFPIAYIRIVYIDYRFQEMIFNSMYAPQNYFCFMIDNKASVTFHQQMKSLAKCFKNIIISEKEYDVDSSGHNIMRSNLHCMRLLLQYPKWKYVILLQNHDFPLKTNNELVQILTVLNGSNDVEMGLPFMERLPKNVTWTLNSLQIFRDPALNDNRTFEFSKGTSEATLSRKFVEYILKTLDLTNLLNHLERSIFGTDEMFLNSINIQDSLNVPGGFTLKCLSDKPAHITRYSTWLEGSKCRTKKSRHYNCIYGVEDLQMLNSLHFIFGNKFYPQFDFTAVSCWCQRLFKLTFRKENRSLDLDYYRELPHVRFNKNAEYNKKHLDSFNCNFKYEVF